MGVDEGNLVVMRSVERQHPFNVDSRIQRILVANPEKPIYTVLANPAEQWKTLKKSEHRTEATFRR